MPPSPTRIEICGGIASGKTTFSNLIARVGFTPVLEEFHKNPFLNLFYRNPQQYAFETELVFLLQHYSQVKALTGLQTYSCDFSFLQDEAYASVNLRSDQLSFFIDLLHHLGAELPSPLLLVYLRCRPECEYERIKRRAREQEKSIELVYLSALNAKIEERVRDLKGLDVLEIDSESMDFASDPHVQSEVCGLIQRRVRSNLSISPAP